MTVRELREFLASQPDHREIMYMDSETSDIFPANAEVMRRRDDCLAVEDSDSERRWYGEDFDQFPKVVVIR